jgi:hypothetical protein
MKNAIKENRCKRERSESGLEVNNSIVVYGLLVPVSIDTAKKTVIKVPSARKLKDIILDAPNFA